MLEAIEKTLFVGNGLEEYALCMDGAKTSFSKSILGMYSSVNGKYGQRIRYLAGNIHLMKTHVEQGPLAPKHFPWRAMLDDILKEPNLGHARHRGICYMSLWTTSRASPCPRNRGNHLADQ